MGVVSITSAVQTFLEGAGISGLNKVYPTPPKLTKEGEFYADPGDEYGVIVFLWVQRQSETLISMAGENHGKKRIRYEFVLDCYARSNLQKTEDVGDLNRTFIDDLTTAIRTHYNANAPGTVFQWGLGDYPAGGDDIQVTSYYPRLIGAKGTTSQIYNEVRVTVVEIITI